MPLFLGANSFFGSRPFNGSRLLVRALLAGAGLTSLTMIAACGKVDAPIQVQQQQTQVELQTEAQVQSQIIPPALIPQRADPQIVRGDNGRYYFIATAPEFDRIELRAADSIKGLATAESQVIWHKHASGPLSDTIWAPELHRFNGNWYIYFAAGDANRRGQIRMYVLTNASEDPMAGNWQELGRVQTARDSFSLDATSFAHNNQRYLIWAQRDPEGLFNSALYIATLDSPTQVGKQETEITRPTLDWEVLGYKVNEGPAVIEHEGKIFVSYSASATDDRYAVGLVWANADADLLDPASWHKSPTPIFFTNPELKRFGPGHNSFTLAEDGKTPLLVYHARVTQQLDGNPLSDPNRHTFVRPLQWTSEGFPDFGQDLANDISN